MEINNIQSFLDYYQRLRERTRRVVLLIPPEQLEWTYRPGKFTLGDLVRHLATIERWLYAENVQGRPPAYPGCGRELADGFEATLAFFDDLHRQSLEIFSRLTPEDLQRKIATPTGMPITCWKWLRALAEHEIHHRGQIYLYLNMLGVATPPLFGLTSEEVLERSQASGVRFTQVSTDEEVDQILALQEKNHSSAVSPEVAAGQGFLTVRHDRDALRRMNRAYPSVIAKAGEQLAGYCLVMPPDFADDVPMLDPLFAMLETLQWQGRSLNDRRWFVMGQVCVAEGFRSQGVFDGMYAKLHEVCRQDFDLVVTEIAESNTRSLRAHARVGFETMHVYRDDANGQVWHVVGWGWE